MNPSFGRRLRAARVMAGMSMDQLVARMKKKVSKQAISKYENGIMAPDSTILIALSEALNVTPEYLMSESDIELVGLNFRKKASLGAKAREMLTEKVRDSLSRYLELETLASGAIPHVNPIAEPKIVDQKQIEDAAARLRTAWGIGPSAPIAHVIGLLEDHGVKVVEVTGFDRFDGLSGFADEKPFIILKSESSTDRKRLTALHEYAHLSLSFAEKIEHRQREKYCHDFAGAVLLPRDVLIRELGPRRSEISFFELRSIKQEYGISMQAILQRAVRVGIASDYLLQSMSIEFSKRGWRKTEPAPLPLDEHPFHFEQLVHRALAEEIISVSKAAYLSGKSIEQIRREMVLSDQSSRS